LQYCLPLRWAKYAKVLVQCRAVRDSQDKEIKDKEMFKTLEDMEGRKEWEDRECHKRNGDSRSVEVLENWRIV
jgi:hypothetical protein